MEVKMSEKTKKLVHIIMPDLLNYLEMVESGEIIKKRLEKNLPREQKEEKEKKTYTAGDNIYGEKTLFNSEIKLDVS